MIKKAYEQSKNFVFVFAVFSLIFYTVGSAVIERGIDSIEKIPVILEKVIKLEKHQDDCRDSTSQCSHDITILQSYHTGH